MRTDGRTTVMTEIIVAFRNYVTAPRTCHNQQWTTQPSALSQNVAGLMCLSVTKCHCVIQKRVSDSLPNSIIVPDCRVQLKCDGTR